jgi:hypothetical protein
MAGNTADKEEFYLLTIPPYIARVVMGIINQVRFFYYGFLLLYHTDPFFRLHK